jgi:hypothetical protein
VAVTVEKACFGQALLSGLSGFSSLEGFWGDRIVYRYLFEVYFPFKSHLPPYFRLG